jgi:hypothetical protein
MNQPITPDRANRLAIGIARARRINYEQAEDILRSLTLRIVLPDDQAGRYSNQVAFFTALNAARRAFLGGVEAIFPPSAPSLLTIPGVATLEDAQLWLGFTSSSVSGPTVYIGTPALRTQEGDICVHCDAWRGGVSDAAEPVNFQVGDDDPVALGGVMAGALAIHRAFLRATHLPARSIDLPLGVSLWDPADDWLLPVAKKIRNLPTRFWILGLGHLGQGFLWNLAFLPFPKRSDVEFTLQDFDTIDESNQGSGLLCRPESIGRKKTRWCATWLERFGFQTIVTERKFGANDRCSEDEPRIAFCGFDRAAPRMHLDTANFALVIECGLGSTLADFDQIDLHTFPSSRHTAHRLWAAVIDQTRSVDESTVRLFGGSDQVCGALAIDTAGKSVSTSFVGAMAGALAVAELVRSFNKGKRFDSVSFDARDQRLWEFRENGIVPSASELAAVGFTTL